MKVKTITSSWLRRNGRRLDCGPYMSGSLEAKIKIESFSRAVPLNQVTSALVNAGRIKRIWVEGAEHGRPFLSSTDILQADLSTLRFISHKAVRQNPKLTIRKGWTLVTRAGSIGRMAYARSEMDGMACTEDVLRVIPDEDQILPGYLYAYLSGKFGVPLVVGGTYGAIIQHIEPLHIADLPVPRLGDGLERKVHDLVEDAAHKRSAASSALLDGVSLLESTADLPPLDSPFLPTPHSVTSVPSRRIQARFDAFFHSLYHQRALRPLAEARLDLKPVAELADQVVEPARFKRIAVDDPDYGIPFFGTSALMWTDPAPSYLLSRGTRNLSDYVVTPKTLLIPRSGQLSGIIGTVVLPYGDLIGGAVSEDAIRVHCPSEASAGFLFVALTSEYGRRQLKARAYGSSIPHLDVKQIGQVLLPCPKNGVRSKIAKLGVSTAKLRHEAIQLEHQARRLVEQAIEEAA